MRILWKTLLLCILTSFLFYLWSSEVSPLDGIVRAESGETSGSTIGGQEIQSLNREEIITLLNTKISTWKDHPILLVGNNTEIEIDPAWITFDVNASVDQYDSQVGKPWYAFWESTPTVHIPLEVVLAPDLTELVEAHGSLNAEETLANIHAQVAVLSEEPIETVALDLSLFESERFAFELEEIPVHAVRLKEMIAVLNEQIIPTNKTFSLLKKWEEANTPFDAETADFIASMLYSVVLQTNYEIVERHSQGTIPTYLEPGIEALVRKNIQKDLTFINNNKTPAVLKMSIKDSSLLVELYSIPMDIVGKYEVREKMEIKPRTIYRYSSDLRPGEEKVIQKGTSGLRVFVYRTISEKNGPFEKEDLISQDYYAPTNHIILKSSLIPEAPSASDPDLGMDLDGDGMPDSDNTPPKTEEEDGSEAPKSEGDTEELPKDNTYDKAGNIINPAH